MIPNKKGSAAPYPKLNSIECKSCRRCVIACPKKVLFIGKELNERGFFHVQYKGEGCIGCGNCYYSCPEPFAIEVHIPQGQED